MFAKYFMTRQYEGSDKSLRLHFNPRARSTVDWTDCFVNIDSNFIILIYFVQSIGDEPFVGIMVQFLVESFVCQLDSARYA